MLFVVFLIVLDAFDSCYSQSFSHNKTRTATATYLYPYDISVDPQGNFQYIGDYSGSTTFGGPTFSTSSTESNIWLAKFDPDFEYLSSYSFGTSGYTDTGRVIAFDSQGDYYITGATTGNLDLGGNAFPSNGLLDVFIAKYYATGTYQWAAVYGDSNDDACFGLAVAADDSIVLTGFITGNVSFGGSVLVSNANSGDMFVTKLGANGAHLWSKRFGGSSLDTGVAVAVDKDLNVLLTGEYQSSDFVINGATLDFLGVEDMVLMKFSSSGALLWYKTFGSFGQDRLYAGAFDSVGNLIIAGNIAGAVDFGQGMLQYAGGTDVAIAKYDPNGNVVWAKSFGSTGTDWITTNSLSIGVDSTIYLTGSYQGSYSFGGSFLPATGLSLGCFVLKLDDAGNHKWSQGYTSTGNTSWGTLEVDTKANKIALAIPFQGTISFGGPDVTAVSSLYYDIALVLLNEVLPTPSPSATPSIPLSPSPTADSGFRVTLIEKVGGGGVATGVAAIVVGLSALFAIRMYKIERAVLPTADTGSDLTSEQRNLMMHLESTGFIGSTSMITLGIALRGTFGVIENRNLKNDDFEEELRKQNEYADVTSIMCVFGSALLVFLVWIVILLRKYQETNHQLLLGACSSLFFMLSIVGLTFVGLIVDAVRLYFVEHAFSLVGLIRATQLAADIAIFVTILVTAAISFSSCFVYEPKQKEFQMK